MRTMTSLHDIPTTRREPSIMSLLVYDARDAGAGGREGLLENRTLEEGTISLAKPFISEPKMSTSIRIL